MKITSNPHSRFFCLLRQMPHQSKEDLVWDHSNMLTTSLSEFAQKRPNDYDRMINDMQRTVDSMKKQEQKPQKQAGINASAKDVFAAKQLGVTVEHLFTIIKPLRSAILKRLQKHGVDTTDMEKVNHFMESKRIAGKRLYEMSEAEMKELIHKGKLESILKKDQKRETEIERMTLMN